MGWGGVGWGWSVGQIGPRATPVHWDGALGPHAVSTWLEPNPSPLGHCGTLGMWGPGRGSTGPWDPILTGQRRCRCPHCLDPAGIGLQGLCTVPVWLGLSSGAAMLCLPTWDQAPQLPLPSQD